jgi:DNA repair protein RadA/Sms
MSAKDGNGCSISGATCQVEQALLGSILFRNSLWPQTEGLTVEDFSLDSHRRIYGRMAAMFEDQHPVDLTTLGMELSKTNQLDCCGGAAYLSDLIEHAFPENFASYVRIVREASVDRQLSRLSEQLNRTHDTERRLALLAKGKEILQGTSSAKLQSCPEIQTLAEVESRDVPWLWEPYIPFSMLTMLTGDPGVGKSFVALAIAADFTRKGGTVIYMSVENPVTYTVRPRFDALGGDPARFHLLRGAQTGEIHRSVTLADVDIIAKAVEQTGARLIIIDPIQSYLGAAVDAHRANETRLILDGLAKLAEKHTLAVLLLRHASKAGGSRAIHRGLGSIDFTGAVRSELFAGKTLEGDRAMAHIKSNVGPLGQTQGYEITLGDGTRVHPAGFFRWTGDSNITCAELTAPEDGTENRTDEAKAFLREQLNDGPRLVDEFDSPTSHTVSSSP